ncbi:type VI secretion system protein TssA [Sulfurimonas sp. MAG313]|nr:type VI secretion system protein TssA [Sulfurimonas sp. MAG313]MDF1879734.1 type VI secretion system protein TssA [Sulfurimonas sp. MAG313]
MSENILAPLSDSLPCGTDFKYEDAFLAIEAEIDKSNSMLEGVSTDWNEVKRATLNLLKNSTKDIKVFSWWIYATWKQEGISGLEKSLILFNSFLSSYKEKLFPKSKKVKLSSLNWLEELLEKEVLDETGSVNTSINTEIFIDIFKDLEDNFSLVVDEEVTVFRRFRSALQRDIKAKEIKPTPAHVSNSSASTGSELNEINSETDANQVLRALKKNAVLLHKYYRDLDSFDIRSIRLVRLVAWLEIDELPMNTDGKTPLNPPSELSINEIESFIKEEDFDEALKSLELLLSLSPFWLEGHFMVFDILSKLAQTRAANEVKNSLITFVKANENILELNFKDNTPFASIKLKQWLAESSSEISVSKSELDIVDTKAETIANAHALAKKKQIKEAMGLLQVQSGLAINQEDKFHWRLAKAELAVEFGKKDVALALLEDLKKDIDRYNLDEWQPELAGKVFNLYLNTFNRTTVDVEDLNIAYARLCKINIAQALEITI